MALSIRYKFLFATLIIISVTTLSYLGIGVQVFKQDKTAYVYDNMAALVDALAEETTTGLNNAWLAMRTLGMLIEIDEVADLEHQQLRELLMAQQGILSLSVREIGTKEPRIAVYDTHELSPYEFADSELEEFSHFTNNDLVMIQEHGAALRLNILGLRLPTITKTLAILDDRGEVSDVVVAQLALDRRIASLQRASTYRSYLVDMQGNYLLHPDKDQLFGANKSLATELIFRISQMDSSRGVFKFDNLPDGPLLVAFRKLDFPGLIMIAETPEYKDFLASDILISRYSYFAGVILGIALLVGIFFTRQLTRALQRLVEATKRISAGDFSVELPVTGRDEVSRLSKSFNTMTNEIRRLLHETAEKARMEKELETAQIVQDSFFPADRVEHDSFQLAAFYKPASECGGDWWHHFCLDNKLYILLGDATGHGVPAALITAAAHSCVATTKKIVSNMSPNPVTPKWLMQQINHAVFSAAKGKVKMTFLIVALDLETGRGVYANASHPMPFYLKLSATEDEIASKNSIDALVGKPSGWLGEAKDLEIEEHGFFLSPGDALILYTDGMVESRNNQDEEFGESRLIRSIVNQCFSDISQVNDQMMKRLNHFRCERPMDDDVTLVTFKLRREINHLSNAS